MSRRSTSGNLSCAEKVPAPQAAAARGWLEKSAAAVHYDGDRLTPELLERQIRGYYAMRDLIDERSLGPHRDQGTAGTHRALRHDGHHRGVSQRPVRRDGPKKTQVCATESDMDGALTMQILKLLTGSPALFADVRHYHADRDVWDLCNSGQYATWFAARSADPAGNLARVHLYPRGLLFPVGGARASSGRPGADDAGPAVPPRWPLPAKAHVGRPGNPMTTRPTSR